MAADEPPRRLSAEVRREQILRAAAVVFGERGYEGATTDLVARAAGISQTYVVRMFGSKERLFLEVVDGAAEVLVAAFRRAIEVHRSDGGDLVPALGRAYIELARAPGVLLPLMQAFMLGHERVIGARARERFLQVWRMLRDEAGFDDADARRFVADGMLVSVLLGLQLPQNAADDDARSLLAAAFGGQLDLVAPAPPPAVEADR